MCTNNWNYRNYLKVKLGSLLVGLPSRSYLSFLCPLLGIVVGVRIGSGLSSVYRHVCKVRSIWPLYVMRCCPPPCYRQGVGSDLIFDLHFGSQLLPDLVY